MNKKGNIEGQFTKSTMVLTETEKTRKIEVEIPKNEAENVQAALLKVNHARGLYEDFFTLNQQFMLYVLSIGLVGKEWSVFVWFLARMDYGNKILINQELIANELKISQSQASKALKKLRDNKIILETKYNVAKYEVSFNYDILNPVAAFKGKASKQNISSHKALMQEQSPYQQHYNINGDIDLINGQTGEVFETITALPQDKARNQEIAIKNSQS